MMYDKLYQYLIQNNELPVPGIGTFLLQRKSAEIDFINRKINPPSYSFAMQQGSHLPEKKFFTWLAQSLGITDREAIFRFNDFTFDLKKQISEGGSINWNGVGSLKKGEVGEVNFIPLQTELILDKPVSAEKVIRQRSEHMVRVGEDEKTSVEMTEMLSQPGIKKSYWWAYAMMVALLSTIFIGWYFSEHGVDISATANSKQLVPGEAAVTYQILP